MFTIDFVTEEGFEKVVLRDTVSATFVALVPGCGALLHSFSIWHDERFLNVIDSYTDQADFNDNLTSKGFKGCKLSPFACRMKNATYHFGEQGYTVEKFLLGNNALHGLLYDAIFSVTDSYADATGAGVEMIYSYTGHLKGYPFHYDCNIRYQLKKDNVLTIITSIINKDPGLLPIQDGWHPYFTFGGKIDALQLEFQSLQKVVMDGDLVPTGELLPYQTFGSLRNIGSTQFDDCFLLNFAECQPLCVLRDTSKNLQLEIYPDKQYAYLQVYTPPHRNSIALENLSAAPDAFNNKMGLITLQPGENINFTTTFKITPLI